MPPVRILQYLREQIHIDGRNSIFRNIMSLFEERSTAHTRTNAYTCPHKSKEEAQHVSKTHSYKSTPTSRCFPGYRVSVSPLSHCRRAAWLRFCSDLAVSPSTGCGTLSDNFLFFLCTVQSSFSWKNKSSDLTLQLEQQDENPATFGYGALSVNSSPIAYFRWLCARTINTT